MSLPPLKQVITADTGQLDRALGNATSRLRRFAGPAGVAAVGAAMVAMTRRAMSATDELTKQARQVGLTTDRFQAMSLVAREAGVSTGALTNTLGIMQRNIVELERGTASQTRAFEALGLSIRDLQGLSPDEQFERIAGALSGVDDSATRTALAMEVFGRSGREVINMLDGYSEKVQDATEFQRRFGIAIDQTDAEAIERANDAVGRVREAFGGLANLMAVRVAPAVENVSAGIINLAGSIADRLNPPANELDDIIRGLPGVMDNAANAEPRLSGALDNITRSSGLTATALQKVSDWLDKIAEKWQRNQALGVPMTMFDETGRFGGIVTTPDTEPEDIEDETRRILDLPPGINVQTPGRGTVRPRAAPAMLGEPLAVPSIGGGGAVRDQFASRLEALQEGLMTEAEIIDEWYQDSLQTLNEGLERKLMTEEEYLEARERLEEEYARRSANIERARQQNNFQIAAEGMGQILNAVGQGNERMMRVAKAFNAGMAWIDTLAGAARELRKGVFGFSTAAAVIARGVGFVNAINSTSTSSRGSVSRGGGATQAQAAPQSIPTQRMIIETQGGGMIGQGQVGQLIDQINEAGRQGYRIEAQFIGGMA